MLNPNEKCAVFLDIDGTLIADKFVIPEENTEAIAKAREKGHLVFINTGRSWGNIPDELRNQLNVDGIIAGSGAVATIGNEFLFKEKMSLDLVKRIYEYFFTHREYSAVFEGMNKVYVLPNELRQCGEGQILLENSDDWKKTENDDIQVIAMAVTAPDDFKELFKDEITVFQFPTYADIVIKGLNKAKGIEKVIELTGIKRENTIAIGDSNNDYDMIEYAGIGVAMANSQQSILDIADYVTVSNREAGVAKAIEKFLL